MKNIIITTIVVLTLLIGVKATADYVEVDNGIRFLRSYFVAGNTVVESFEDTKQGVVCYTVNNKYNNSGVGISCIKK